MFSTLLEVFPCIQTKNACKLVIPFDYAEILVYLYHFCHAFDPLGMACKARTQALCLLGFLPFLSNPSRKLLTYHSSAQQKLTLYVISIDHNRNHNSCLAKASDRKKKNGKLKFKRELNRSSFLLVYFGWPSTILCYKFYRSE